MRPKAMLRPLRLAVLAVILTAGRLTAQHSGGGAPPIPAPPAEAAQFDFLVGEWDLAVKVPAPSLAARIHGLAPKLRGVWKGWRGLDGFGIEDELRITDEAGNPRSFSHAVRYFDPVNRRWATTGLDVYRGRTSTGTAQWNGREMLVTTNGTDLDGKPVVSRSRWYDITPAGFKFVQDRSTDGGKTWAEGTIRIDAKRVGASPAR